jgi:hypothetical protein
VERFKFSFCKETTRWDTTIAYLELKQKPEQPPNEYLHAVVRLYTRESKALLAEQIKLFADNVTYTFSQQQSAALLHGTADEQATRNASSGKSSAKHRLGAGGRGQPSPGPGHHEGHGAELQAGPHVRQAIRLKAPQGLPPLELEKLIMLQVQSRDKNGAANGFQLQEVNDRGGRLFHRRRVRRPRGGRGRRRQRGECAWGAPLTWQPPRATRPRPGVKRRQ